ncbi:hypothetical protein [Modestobacter lapidis]|nr:hypothetical protein [Modestobacter lapidis]
MGTSKTPTLRLASGLAAAGLLLVPLSACSDDPVSDASGALDTGASEASSAPAEETTESTPEATSTDGPTSAGGSDAPMSSGVDCSGTSCSVTLAGDGTEVEVLGTTISLGQVDGDRATISVAGQEASCSQGEEVSAGPLTLECTTVAPDGVTLTASLG